MNISPKINRNQIKFNISKNDLKENKDICETEENNESIDYIVQKNQPYITSLKIYKCIVSYFEFYQNLKSNLENINKKPTYGSIFIIDESWLNNFKIKSKYNLIENSVSSKKILSPQDYKILVNDFAKKYPLSPEILENFPKKPKHITKDGNKSDYYYDNYEFIDEQTMNNFKEAFNNNIDKLNKYNK